MCVTRVESVVEGLAKIAEKGEHDCAGDDVGTASDETADGAACEATSEAAGFGAVLGGEGFGLPCVEDDGSAC